MPFHRAAVCGLIEKADEIREQGARVVPLVPDVHDWPEVNGEKLWIKFAVPPKATLWHRVQAFLARGVPVLSPSVSAGGAQALRSESAKLAAFRACGILVPEVLGMTDRALILSHAGAPLHVRISSRKTSGEKHALARIAAQALAAVHRAGLCHGRPHL